MVVTFPIETPAQRQVLGVAIAFSILAVVAVCLRLLSHHLANKKWITSDYFIIAAAVSICLTKSKSMLTNTDICRRPPVHQHHRRDTSGHRL